MATDFTLAGDYAYITGNMQPSLHVVDISDPTSLPVVAFFELELGNHHEILAAGNYLYVAGTTSTFLYTYDLADPSYPVFTGNMGNQGYYIKQMVSAGNFIYAIGASQLLVLDISDPYTPEIAGIIQFADITVTIDISGKYLYISTYEDYERVYIFEII